MRVCVRCVSLSVCVLMGCSDVGQSYFWDLDMWREREREK